MKAERIPADLFMLAEDWRPEYQLSHAAWLSRHAGLWEPLGRFGPCLDGWRVSTNPAASGYDPRIEQTPVYRLRHVEPMDLRTEAEHWLPPQVADQPYCVRPGDVLVRRVGRVAAALVGERHRRHPADANLGIVRGLPPGLALWAAWCLNQPHYRDYLEGAETIGELVRVGLGRLAGMPLAPPPAGLDSLAQRWSLALDQDTQGLEALDRLRREVADWTAERLAASLPGPSPLWIGPGHAVPLKTPGVIGAARQDAAPAALPRYEWFGPLDLDDQWSMALCEQRRIARALRESGLGVPLGALAQISPRAPKVRTTQSCRVLRIGDLDRQFGYAECLPPREQTAWRSQTRALTPGDVLVSTFAAEPKVALADRPVEGCILPSEQLITLCFHRHQGAYALIMESPLIQAQWTRLATGAGMRFVQPGLVGRIVLPVPEDEQAADWHHRLVDILARRREARRRMQAILGDLGRLYRDLHPDAGPSQIGPQIGPKPGFDQAGADQGALA